MSIDWTDDEPSTGVHHKTLQLFQRVTAVLAQLDAVQQDNLFRLLAVWPSFSTAKQQAIVMFILTFVETK